MKNFLYGALEILGLFVMFFCVFVLVGGVVSLNRHSAAVVTNSSADHLSPATAKVQARTPAAVAIQPQETPVLTINDQNSVVLDSAFEENSVADVMRQMQALSDASAKNAPLYLVLNTPGGRVDSGQKLVSFLKALPQKVHTITIFAASMGFQTVQQLNDRLILPTGTLMSHPPSFGVDGETPYQVKQRLNWIMSMTDDMDQKAANRMGMNLRDYQDLIHDELWLYGANGVASRAADKVVLVKCGKYKNATKWITVDTLFGAFQVELSSCPLIPGVVSIKAPKGADEKTTNYVKTMVTDRTAFTKEYITTNKYLNFMR